MIYFNCELNKNKSIPSDAWLLGLNDPWATFTIFSLETGYFDAIY